MWHGGACKCAAFRKRAWPPRDALGLGELIVAFKSRDMCPRLGSVDIGMEG